MPYKIITRKRNGSESLSATVLTNELIGLVYEGEVAADTWVRDLDRSYDYQAREIPELRAALQEIGSKVSSEPLPSVSKKNSGPGISSVVCIILGLVTMVYFFFVYMILAKGQALSPEQISTRECGCIFGAALFIGGAILSHHKRSASEAEPALLRKCFDSDRADQKGRAVRDSPILVVRASDRM